LNSIFQVLTLAWSLQGGQYFGNAINDDGVFSTNDNYFFQTSFEFQIPLSWVKGDKNQFYVGAESENQFFKHQFSDWTMSPYQDTFDFHAGIRFIGIELGFDHRCVHPVIFSQNYETSKIFSSFDKVHVKISGEL